MKHKVYVVSIQHEGNKLYYVKQHSRITHEDGAVLNEPLGIFSHDLLDARKYTDKAQAEWIASYFEEAHIEMISSAEQLKGGC